VLFANHISIIQQKLLRVDFVPKIERLLGPSYSVIGLF